MLTETPTTSTAVFLSFALVINFPARAAAECIGTASPFKGSRSVVVFAGTIIKREVVSRFDPTSADPVRVGAAEQLKYLDTDFAVGMRLTFDVHQVWKGPSQRTIVMYQILNPDSVRTWNEKTPYVIAGNLLSENERSRILRLDQAENGFLIADCSTHGYTRAIEKHLRRVFGSGSRPKSGSR